MHKRLVHNNFDLLRLLLSVIVCLAHAYELSGFMQLQWLTAYFTSGYAVKAFFVVSGFLVFMSYERSISVASYLEKRARRIFPAYFTVIVLLAFLLVLVSNTSGSHYFLSGEWARYLLSNLAFLNFLQPTLPGVFETNPIHAVNGALWTLKIEVMFYCCVPLLVYLCRKFKPLWVLLAVYFLSQAYHVVVARYNAELAMQLPGQMCYFVAGALLYYYLTFFERHVAKFVAAAILALVLKASLLTPMAIGILVIFAALYFYLGNFSKYGDFSYGFYILHYPIIQLYVASGVFDGKPWIFLLTVVGTTTVASVALWHLVEKRFLTKSSHYTRATVEGKAAPEAVALPGSTS